MSRHLLLSLVECPNMSIPTSWLNIRNLGALICCRDSRYTLSNVTLQCSKQLSRRGDSKIEDEKNAMALPIVAAVVILSLLFIVIGLSFCQGARNIHFSAHSKNQPDAESRKSHDTVWDVDTDWSEDDPLDREHVKDMHFGYVFSANKVRPGLQPRNYDGDLEKGRWLRRISGMLGGIPSRKRLVDAGYTPGAKRARWLIDDEAARV